MLRAGFARLSSPAPGLFLRGPACGPLLRFSGAFVVVRGSPLRPPAPPSPLGPPGSTEPVPGGLRPPAGSCFSQAFQRAPLRSGGPARAPSARLTVRKLSTGVYTKCVSDLFLPAVLPLSGFRQGFPSATALTSPGGNFARRA